MPSSGLLPGCAGSRIPLTFSSSKSLHTPGGKITRLEFLEGNTPQYVLPPSHWGNVTLIKGNEANRRLLSQGAVTDGLNQATGVSQFSGDCLLGGHTSPRAHQASGHARTGPGDAGGSYPGDRVKPGAQRLQNPTSGPPVEMLLKLSWNIPSGKACAHGQPLGFRFRVVCWGPTAGGASKPM